MSPTIKLFPIVYVPDLIRTSLSVCAGFCCEPVALAMAFNAPRKSEVALSQLDPSRFPLSVVATYTISKLDKFTGY